MTVQPDRGGKWSRLKRLLLLVGILVMIPGCCCWMSYRFQPDLYLFVVGRYYYHMAKAKVPEFDRLNDELMAKLPTYPGAVLIPGMEFRGGPGEQTLVGGPDGPRDLRVCYKANASMSEIVDFYKHNLQQDNWKLVYTNSAYMWQFSQNKACVVIEAGCSCQGYGYLPGCSYVTDEHYPTPYRVIVYYNLNKLLGFPGVPDGGCP